MSDRDISMLLDSLLERIEQARESADRDEIDRLETQYRIAVSARKRLENA